MMVDGRFSIVACCCLGTRRESVYHQMDTRSHDQDFDVPHLATQWGQEAASERGGSLLLEWLLFESLLYLLKQNYSFHFVIQNQNLAS